MDRLQLFANPNSKLTIIDLGLFPGSGLKAHRRQLRPLALGSEGLQITLNLLITAYEPQAHQFAVQHHTVPSHLGPTLRDEFSETARSAGAEPVAYVAANRP